VDEAEQKLRIYFNKLIVHCYLLLHDINYLNQMDIIDGKYNKL